MRRAALRVEEELRPVPLVEVGAPVREVAPQRLDRVPAHRDDALLVALAGAADEPLLEIDAGAVEADGLAHAEAGAVEQLDQRAVAHRSAASSPRPPRSAAAASAGESVRGSLRAPARQLERRGGAVGPRAEQHEVPEERADRGHAARDRRGGEPAARSSASQRSRSSWRRLRGRPAEPVAERAQVAAVRLDGLRRPARREQREEALDLGIGSSRIGPRLGHRTFLFRPGVADACRRVRRLWVEQARISKRPPASSTGRRGARAGGGALPNRGLAPAGGRGSARRRSCLGRPRALEVAAERAAEEQARVHARKSNP